jgi:hypothetical protein
MANQYATAADAINRNPALATFDTAELEALMTATSRWIDAYCGRKFWLDPTVTDRVFHVCDMYVLDLGEHEIGDLTGVIVKTDDGTGTFATTVSSTAYQLEPVNAPYTASAARPYTAIRAVNTTWPLTYGPYGRQSLVRVTAKYGWPAVPAAVREACLSMAIVQAENPTGVRAEAIDGYSVSYGRADLESSVGTAIRNQLAPFRRMWVA